MPYIGKNPLVGNYTVLDSLTATTTDTYALTKNSVAVFPQTPANCIVSLNGVIQAPFDSYTISGSNIVFASALTASDSIDFITVLGDVLNVGTVSDGTITTAKIQDGAVTSSKLASGVGGKVLQVVTSTKTDTFSISTGNTWVDITGLSLNITPSSASNKILLMYNISLGTDGGSGYGYTKLLRGATNIFVGDSAGSRILASCGGNSPNTNTTFKQSIQFLDSPSTTSLITYKIQGFAQAGTGIMYINRGYNDADSNTSTREASSITAIEISG